MATVSSRRYVGWNVALIALVAITLPATLTLPRNPWREASSRPASSGPTPNQVDPTVDLIQKTGIGGVILADAPGFQRRFAATGITVIPLWSPQADWLFDLKLSEAEAARGWRISGVRFVVLTKWRANLDFFNSKSRWARAPFDVQPLGETPTTAIFTIRARE